MPSRSALVEEEDEGGLVGEEVLAEGGAEASEPFADGREARLLRLGELGAGMDEALPVAFQHAGLLGRETERVARRPQRVDAGEERGVGADLGPMTRQARGDVALQRADGVVGVGAGLQPEQAGDAREAEARRFERDHRVGEGGGRRLVGDGGDLGLMGGQHGVEAGADVAVGHRLEARQAVGPFQSTRAGLIGSVIAGSSDVGQMSRPAL